MRAELDQALCRDFPLLFRDRQGSMMETCMSWGFECGDGWEPLIRRAAKKLEKLIQDYKDAHPDLEETYLPCASQVKEKYGELRFYMSSETPEMSAVIDKAESKSRTTCEACGKPGKIRGSGWYYTACATHTKEYDNAT